MKRFFRALAAALFYTIVFSGFIALGLTIGVALAPYVHWSLLHMAIAIVGLTFVTLTALYYRMNK
jgi:hypothetical protein